MKSVSSLKEADSLIQSASIPQDLFGHLSANSNSPEELDRIQKVFRKLTKLVHPDVCKNKNASVLFDKLDKLRNEAEKLVTGEKDKLLTEHGVLLKPVSFKSLHFAYTLTRQIAKGGTCSIFEGVAKDRLNNMVHVISRVARSHKDSDLMDREAKAYALMNAKLKEMTARGGEGEDAAKRFSWKIPYFVESIKLKEGPSTKTVNVFSRLEDFCDGWYSVKDIHRQYVDGVDIRIMGFIFNRMLEALTFIHACGVVHGAVTPNHIMIHAKSHVGNLIDFSSSCHSGTSTLPFVDKRWTDLLPPEVLKDKRAFASSDVYMLAMSMVYLTGGRSHAWETKYEPIRQVLSHCLQPNRAKRLTAQAAYDKFQQALRSVFGPPKFVELQMTPKV